jgi:hypothetical protein
MEQLTVLLIILEHKLLFLLLRDAWVKVFILQKKGNKLKPLPNLEQKIKNKVGQL